MIRGPMRPLAAAAIFCGLLATRLCQAGVLWVEEGYPAAAAIQILYGKALYRDVWFDKPPLSAFFYLLWGAWPGWPQRLAGALFVFGCCLLIARFACDAWGEREGLAAGCLLAFFLTFGIPAAVIPLAPDLLMIAPHVAAVWLAWRGRAFWAGLAAGVATLVNAKGVFVLAACLLGSARSWPLILAGFALPNAAALAWFGRPYWDQVWIWGAVYARQGFAFSTGFTRTLNWAGFQIALILGAVWFAVQERDRRKVLRFAAWIAISLAAVAGGWRFFPRYYFQLLVPFTIVAARGWVLLGAKRPWMLMLLLIPLIRFGPRYVTLAADLKQHREPRWSDLDLSQDTARAAALIPDRGGTLLVWGYRPDLFALTRMRAGTRFLDSQPLTGVIADRHLASSEAAYAELAARNRAELIRTRPDYVVDGLGPINPALAISGYADLQEWLGSYREIGRTRLSVVYGRKPSKP